MEQKQIKYPNNLTERAQYKKSPFLTQYKLSEVTATQCQIFGSFELWEWLLNLIAKTLLIMVSKSDILSCMRCQCIYFGCEWNSFRTIFYIPRIFEEWLYRNPTLWIFRWNFRICWIASFQWLKSDYTHPSNQSNGNSLVHWVNANYFITMSVLSQLIEFINSFE